MRFESGDIIYATLVIGLAIFGYRVIRSVTMGLLTKVIVTGGGLAFLFDFHANYGWKLGAANKWLWSIAAPDLALIIGIVTGLALTLRDRYAPMLSEAGFMVQMKGKPKPTCRGNAKTSKPTLPANTGNLPNDWSARKPKPVRISKGSKSKPAMNAKRRSSAIPTRCLASPAMPAKPKSRNATGNL